MTRTRVTPGNSQALIIDHSTMDALGMDLDSPLKITIHEGRMIVTPANQAKDR
jgi:antitoxin component of MazEF toxin-antitoxin module